MKDEGGIDWVVVCLVVWSVARQERATGSWPISAFLLMRRLCRVRARIKATVVASGVFVSSAERGGQTMSTILKPLMHRDGRMHAGRYRCGTQGQMQTMVYSPAVVPGSLDSAAPLKREEKSSTGDSGGQRAGAVHFMHTTPPQWQLRIYCTGNRAKVELDV